MEKSIGFIGAGNIAGAMIRGLTAGSTAAGTIHVYDIDRGKTEGLRKAFGVGVAADSRSLVAKCRVIVLSVKPDVYRAVLREICDLLHENHIIVTLAAGISTACIQRFSDRKLRIIRAMPNIPVFVGEGMIAITGNDRVSEADYRFVSELFGSIGRIDRIDEGLMNMIPAVSGSSPAFVYMFIESLADGAVMQGMSRDKAYRYAAQAVLGSAKMVLESGKHPAELKDMVCSPAGTTIDAVCSLEKRGFRGTVIEAMNVCTAKVRRLAGD